MHVKRLLGDLRGVSAIEFALIAPVMIVLYLGLAELTMMMMAQRRASHVASAIGDLVTQGPTTKAADLDSIFLISKNIIAPFPSASLSMRLVSITADANGVTTVAWRRATGPGYSSSDLAPGSAITIPTGLIGANEGIVQAETKYTYAGVSKYVLKQGFTFNEKFYLRPRQGVAVTCGDCGS